MFVKTLQIHIDIHAHTQSQPCHLKTARGQIGMELQMPSFSEESPSHFVHGFAKEANFAV